MNRSAKRLLNLDNFVSTVSTIHHICQTSFTHTCSLKLPHCMVLCLSKAVIYKKSYIPVSNAGACGGACGRMGGKVEDSKQ